ncbi:hypothetical protein COUCH_27600 [Couchioplanes caeruleus]|uniref:hypothetical protein n=1 Tax=Couchioplanes caeruleus TaxID=56438 RepID=UPI0020BD6649|nr:hypothetical protein [Couchioplanes caeruleus]UQU62782.1 hypothetical protein COUCH_27600 [Couchioplanes caeruleus]
MTTTDQPWAPDACTLPTAGRPLRLAEFDALFASAARHIDVVTPTRAVIRLAGPRGLAATVRDLTARETACCSFFTFTVTAAPAAVGEEVSLHVDVPVEYAHVLRALAERAASVAPRIAA